MIEGRQWLIFTDVLDSNEADENGSIDNDGAASDEEYDSGSLEAIVITGFTQSGTEEVE